MPSATGKDKFQQSRGPAAYLWTQHSEGMHTNYGADHLVKLQPRQRRPMSARMNNESKNSGHPKGQPALQ